MDDKVKSLFKTLDINEKDFPRYQNAELFAKSFKKCSITENVFTTSSNNTYKIEPKNN